MGWPGSARAASAAARSSGRCIGGQLRSAAARHTPSATPGAPGSGTSGDERPGPPAGADHARDCRLRGVADQASAAEQQGCRLRHRAHAEEAGGGNREAAALRRLQARRRVPTWRLQGELAIGDRALDAGVPVLQARLLVAEAAPAVLRPEVQEMGDAASHAATARRGLEAAAQGQG